MKKFQINFLLDLQFKRNKKNEGAGAGGGGGGGKKE